MKLPDDMLPEEQDQQYEELNTLLQQANLNPLLVDPRERTQILSRARARLFPTDHEVSQPEDMSVPELNETGYLQSKPKVLANKPHQGRRLIRLISVLAAVVVVTALIGSGLLSFGPWSPFQKVHSSTAPFTLKQPIMTIPAPQQTGAGGLYRFPFGQCTYWANMRYHALTGYWVPWLENADQWAYGASISGWIVSSKPRVPSIIVLQSGVEGASGYGQIAIVERINSDGSVYTSNYNWYANGVWDILSYVTFTPGPGVSFVWHP